MDEHDDAGSVEGAAEADVVEVSVDAQADSAGLDAVVVKRPGSHRGSVV